MTEHHPLDERAPSGLDRARAKLEFRLDPKIKAVTKELEAINRELANLSVDGLPKKLQVKVGKREYTSIRRLEISGTGISRSEIPNEDPYLHILDYKIREGMIGEGMVGVLLLPWTLGAEPVGKDVIEFLESQEDFDNLGGWGVTLPTSIDKGRPFNLNEWNLKHPLFASAKRARGKLYSQREMPIYTRILGRHIGIARRIIPDEEGMITMLRNSFWWTREEIGVQRELDEKFAAFYVLVEGKSEQERQDEPGGVRKLGLRPSEVTV